MFTREQLAILQLLSNPHRVRMMALLGQGPKTVSELVDQCGADINVGIVNSQIHVLRGVSGGLVETEKVQGQVRHRLLKDKVADALGAVIYATGLEIPPRSKISVDEPARKKRTKKAAKKRR